MSEAKPAGFWSTALESWWHVLRAIALTAALIVGTLGGLYALFRASLQALRSEDVSLTYDPENQRVLLAPGRDDVYYLTYAASSRWMNTGVVVPPGGGLRISAVGKVHLAFHNLEEAVQTDSLPRFGWVGADGAAFRSSGGAQSPRQEFLLMPDRNIGALLGYFAPQGGLEPGPENARPASVFYIGLRHELARNVSAEPAVLWLNVNDLHLDPERLDESREAYVGDPRDAEYERRVAHWPYIVQNAYWDLWWDDNVGQFFIQVEVIEGDGSP